jgi:hypothetical protein
MIDLMPEESYFKKQEKSSVTKARELEKRLSKLSEA